MDIATWTSPMVLPEKQSSIFVDIETDLDCNRVWLVGVVLGNTYEQFLAHHFGEEKIILEEFASYLEKHPNKALICYSTTNFDFRILWQAAERLNLDKLKAQLHSRALIDLGTLLRRHCKFHIRKYSLKTIRYLIDYKYEDETISGEDIAIEYYILQKKYGKITPEFAKKALRYNLDDILILQRIVNKFEDNIQYNPSYCNQVPLEKISEKLKNKIVGYNFTDNMVRITVNKKDRDEIRALIMSKGVPLPQEKVGQNVCAFYWKSRFSYQMMEQFVSKANLFATD